MAVVETGIAVPANAPAVLMTKDQQLIDGEQPDRYQAPTVWAFRAYNNQIEATTAFLSGNDEQRAGLLEHVTWPPGPAAPSSGGLALPSRIEYAMSDVPPTNFGYNTTDPAALSRIRSALAGLRDPVPPGEECVLREPNRVGIRLGGDDEGGTTVVLGDETCPQAVSTDGGRVRVPPGLGRELQGLVESTGN